MIDFVLVGDGSSDRALVSPLQWAIRRWTTPFEITFADLRGVRLSQGGLAGRLTAARDLYGVGRTVLLVHRDAETEPAAGRVAEIEAAVAAAEIREWIAVVPVRMTEAWLLTDESAIRSAAGNPNGKEDLSLPAVSRLERLPDPKQVLYDALCTACGKSGRHLQKFKSRRMRSAVHRVAELTADFAPLLALPAFQEVDDAIRLAVTGTEV